MARGARPFARGEPPDLPSSQPVGEESAGVRGVAVRPASVRRNGGCSGDRRLWHLLPAVRRRVPNQRHRGPRERSPASPQETPADCVRRLAGSGGADVRCRARRFCPVGCIRARADLLRRGGRLPGTPGAVLGPAQTHRHHRRADDCHRLRAPGGGRGGRDRRQHQPVAARLHDPAGAVHFPGQAPPRARAARRWRGQPPPDSSANTARICSIR